MIRFNVYLFLLFFLSACASISQKDDKGFNWKKASAKLTREYAKSMGPLSPEWISGVFSVRAFDNTLVKGIRATKLSSVLQMEIKT
jgi:hypothetical protein